MKTKTEVAAASGIVRIDKKTGDIRPSDRAEVERIIWLNYSHPDNAIENFEQGQRIESPFAYYEFRRETQPAKEVA